MKILLFLLLPLCAFAQESKRASWLCGVPGCLVYHSYDTLELLPSGGFALPLDSLRFIQTEDDSLIRIAPDNLPTQSAQKVEQPYSVWDGVRVGCEFYNRFQSPYQTSFGAYGDVRLNLSRDLSVAARVMLPFGMDAVNYRIMLDKKIF